MGTTEEAWHLFTRAVEAGVLAGATDESVALVGQAYVDLPGRETKVRARAFLDDYIDDALDANDAQRASVCSKIRKALKVRAWRTETPPRKKQRVEKYVELAASLQLAFGLCVTEVPADIRPLLADDWYDSLEASAAEAVEYRHWLLDNPDTRGPEPKVAEVCKKAARMSLGRAPGAAGRPPIVNNRKVSK